MPYIRLVEITPSGSNFVTFKQGWHSDLEGDPISPHRWSVGLDATIQIPKLSSSPIQQGLFTIELDAIPYLPKTVTAYQDVIIFLDGSLISCIRLYDADVKKVTGQFSNPVNHNPFSLLKFYFPQSNKPSLCGDGNDERQLGIGLKSMKIEIF